MQTLTPGKNPPRLLSAISNTSIVIKSFLSYLLVLFIPVTVSGVFIYNNHIGNLSMQKDSLLIKLVAQYRDDIHAKISTIEYLSDKIITSKSIKQFFYYVGDDIYKKIEEQNNVISPYLLFLSDLDQSVYQIKFYSFDENIPEGPYISSHMRIGGEEWFDEVRKLKGNEGKWEPVHPCRSDLSTKNEPVFTYYRNMFSQNYNTVVATLQIDIRKDVLMGEFEGARLEKSGYLFVSDRYGNVISGQREAMGERRSLQKSIMSEVPNRKGKFIHRYGEQAYVIYSEPLEKLGLFLVATVPLQEYNGNIDAQRNLFLLVILLSLVGLGILAYFINGLNYKRIKKVLQGIRRLSHGELQARVEIRGKDEIGEIAEDLNVMAEKLDDMIKVAYKAKIAEKEAMLSALQSQIHPHFLYNTLESIRMMAEIKGELDVSDALTTLGKFLRYNISTARETVTLKAEVENMHNYFSIQKLRFKHLINLHTEIQEGTELLEVPKMILQPLVENAILHGTGGKQNPVWIRLIAKQEEGILLLTVRNSGCSIPRQRLEELQASLKCIGEGVPLRTSGSGIGLRNINERIKLYYGEEFGVAIENFIRDELAGVEVSIRLPAERREG